MESIKQFLHPSLIWFFVGLIMLLLEFAGPGLIIFFFATGAWIVAILCFFLPLTLNMQLFLFIITSLLSLIILRKHLQKVFKGHIKSRQDLDKDLDDFVGKKAVVIETISPNFPGKIEFHGTSWTAESNEGIEINSNVEIISKDSLVLKVKKHMVVYY